MATLRQILEEKGGDIWSVDPKQTVYEAIAHMAAKGVGALVVLDGERLVGMITERDYARKVILKGKLSRDITVDHIMTSPVVCGRPDQDVEECMALMTEKHFRHLPVLENDELIGIISIGDLVKAIIAEQRFEIEQLRHYIVG